ncbi:MAG TPA: GNAT family N-acetyltransferase [Chryseosolibacter sp.]
METKPGIRPSLSHSEPVLAVSDIEKTVTYYHEVLGFPEKWTWGEPPNHGGVSWNGAGHLQFSLDRDLAAKAHGESVWVRVKQLESLFRLHEKNQVEIVVPMTKRPWGFAEYIIRDINGYYLTFAEPFSEGKKSGTFPLTIQIADGAPSRDETRKLCEAVGWAPAVNAAIDLQIESALYSVVAEDLETHEIVGCAFLVGDDKTIYYVKDVIVHPLWQGKGIGTAMMKKLMGWLDAYGSENATVGLFTGEHLAAFYRQFGFTQACGMYKQMKRPST